MLPISKREKMVTESNESEEKSHSQNKTIDSSAEDFFKNESKEEAAKVSIDEQKPKAKSVPSAQSPEVGGNCAEYLDNQEKAYNPSSAGMNTSAEVSSDTNKRAEVSAIKLDRAEQEGSSESTVNLQNLEHLVGNAVSTAIAKLPHISHTEVNKSLESRSLEGESYESADVKKKSSFEVRGNSSADDSKDNVANPNYLTTSDKEDNDLWFHNQNYAARIYGDYETDQEENDKASEKVDCNSVKPFGAHRESLKDDYDFWAYHHLDYLPYQEEFAKISGELDAKEAFSIELSKILEECRPNAKELAANAKKSMNCRRKSEGKTEIPFSDDEKKNYLAYRNKQQRIAKLDSRTREIIRKMLQKEKKDRRMKIDKTKQEDIDLNALTRVQPPRKSKSYRNSSRKLKSKRSKLEFKRKPL